MGSGLRRGARARRPGTSEGLRGEFPEYEVADVHGQRIHFATLTFF
jgi:hypothetical protein